MLLINNQEVEQLLPMKDCIEVIEEGYRELAAGRAANFPEGGRMDVQAPSPGEQPKERMGRELPTEWFLQDIRD